MNIISQNKETTIINVESSPFDFTGRASRIASINLVQRASLVGAVVAVASIVLGLVVMNSVAAFIVWLLLLSGAANVGVRKWVTELYTASIEKDTLFRKQAFATQYTIPALKLEGIEVSVAVAISLYEGQLVNLPDHVLLMNGDELVINHR